MLAATVAAVERVSVGPGPAFQQGNGASTNPVISADGRYVAFVSAATNLWTTGSDSADLDVLVKDRATGEVRMISRKESLRAILSFAGTCAGPAITLGGGLRVAFSNDSVNSVGGCADGNSVGDVYSGAGLDEAELLSTFASGAGCPTQANGTSLNPALSADGARLAMESLATNLVSGDTNGDSDIFIRILPTGAWSRASIRTSLAFPFTITQANGPSFKPALSASGTVIAFESDATNLVTTDTNNRRDIFVRDITGIPAITSRVSVATDGTQGNGNSSNAVISGDGRWVAFQSTASNLVAGDTNGDSDVFLHDRTTGETTRVSVLSLGGQSNGPSTDPSISADGRLIAFTSAGTNFASGLPAGMTHVYVHERVSRRTVRLDNASGEYPNGSASAPSLTADGLLLAFQSDATNLYLVEGDTNGVSDVFVANVPPISPHDDCRTTPLFTNSAHISGATSFATTDGGASCHLDESGPDVWLRFRSTSGGAYSVRAAAMLFGSVLSVHTGCPRLAGSDEIGCSRASGPFSEHVGVLTMAPGDTVWIRFAGDFGGTGEYSIRVLPIPPNDSCATASPIGDGAHPFDTRAATTDPFGVPCFIGSPRQDIWYRYTAPVTGTVTAQTCGADFDTLLSVFPFLSCPPTQRLVCGNDECGSQSRVQFQATAGTQYLIQVAGSGLPGLTSPDGTGVLSIASVAACAADFNGDGNLDPDDLSDYITCFFTNVQIPGACPQADFNADGNVDPDDLSDYITAFFAGCP